MPHPDPIAGLDGLYFAAKLLVDGLYTGRHASPLRGAGIEFHDYRPYTPGDDLRTIDWKLYGRTDRYYLKRFRRETDLNLHVAVDGSASMQFARLGQEWDKLGGRGKSLNRPTKFAVAQQLAAALVTLAIRQGDRAGLAVFDKRLRAMHPPTGSVRRLQTMLADLEHAEPSRGEADLPASLEQLTRTLRGRRAAIAVVSDLLDEPGPLIEVFDKLRFAGHEVIVFQVMAPDEMDLGTDGSRGLRMIDPETGRWVDSRPRSVADRYRLLMREHLESIRVQLTARGIDYVMVNTTESLIGVLRRYLILRAARAR